MADYNYPVAVSHQGKAIYFASRRSPASGEWEYFYQVLELRIDSENDQLDWAGYKKLAFPPTVSPAGMSLVEVTRAPATGPRLRVVSDQKYVYVFRSGERQIYASRYNMVEVPNPRLSGDKDMELQPAWQVRYQRSASPNVPASDKDSMSFVAMDGVPFLEPVVELALGDKDAFQLDAGPFSVQLVPTEEASVSRWQLFVVETASGRLFCYSLPRSDDGWFAVGRSLFSGAKRFVRPDVVLQLQLDGADLALAGQCDTVLYLKQEDLLRNDAGAVKMQRGYRLLLAAEAGVAAPGARGIATLDFGIGIDGIPACLQPVPSDDEKDWVKTFAVGRVESAAFNLSFEEPSYVSFDHPANPIVVAAPFSQEMWLNSSSRDTDAHEVWGGTSNPLTSPPVVEVVAQRRIRVGFGNGTTFLSAATAEDVILPGTWNHVAAVFDGAAYVVYVNGIAVPLTSDDFSGAAVPQSALDRMGVGFSGQLDEVRLWQRALTADDVRRYMDRELPDSVVKDPAQMLVGYWKLDDGSGRVADDSSLANRAGELHGAQWTPSSSPVAPATSAATYFDDRSLSFQAGLIVPDPSDPGARLFGDIKPGSSPWLLSSCDGMVHLYYQGSGDQFVAAHYDATESRALFRLATEAGPQPSEAGTLTLASRQMGTFVNRGGGQLAAAGHPPLVDLTLTNGPNAGAITETWKGLPPRVEQIVSVLSGRAISQPDDPRLLEPDAVFYDYSGARTVGYVRMGDPPLLASLVFASRSSADFVVDRLRLGAGTAPDLAELVATITATRAGRSASVTRTMLNVPRDTPLFLQVVNGNAISTVYDYDDPANRKPGESLMFSLPAGADRLLVVVPDTSVTGASFDVRPAAAPGACDVKIRLDRGGVPLEATWNAVPRGVREFVETIEGSTSSPQKDVASYLFFRPGYQDAAVDDAVVGAPSGLHALVSFWVALNDHASGDVPDFDCALGRVQGATTTALFDDSVLARGSDLFSVLAPGAPVNGYPARIALDGLGRQALALFKPGENGGWIPESPRYAVALDGTGGLVVDDVADKRRALVVTGDRTVEAWVNPRLVPGPATSSDPLVYPRVVHANLADGNATSRYLLAYEPMYYLQGTDDTRVAVTDTALPANDPLRLFASDAFSLQLYLSPNLDTIDTQGLVWHREALDAAGATIGHERLTIAKDGRLTFSMQPASGPAVSVTSSEGLPNGEWSCTVVTRSAATISFYRDGAPIGGGTAPALAAPRSRFILGNDGATLGAGAGNHFEAKLSLMSIWNAALSASQVKARARTFVPNGDDGLVLMWRMEEIRNDKRITNSAELTGSVYDTAYTGDAFFNFPGLFYRVAAAADSVAAVTKNAMIAPGAWNHLAMVYDAHYGVALDGSTWADCGGADALNVQSELTIEAWVKVPAAGVGADNRVIFSKYGPDDAQQSYELGLTRANQVYLKVRLEGETDSSGTPVTDESKKHFLYTAKASIPADTAAYVTATFALQQVAGSEKQKKPVGILYVDGTAQALSLDSARNLEGSVSLTQSATSANIGRTKPNGLSGESYFVGVLSDLAVYNKALTAFDVAAAFRNRSAPRAAAIKPISSWSFREQKGTVAYDDAGDNNALFDSSEMWTLFAESSTLALWVNGRSAPLVTRTAASLGGWGDAQFRIGMVSLSATAFRNRLVGELDEVRVWNHARTPEQITDNMFRYLPGSEEGLRGYWRFDAGSGDEVVDQTGRGNTARFFAAPGGRMPTWVTSTAPVSDEAGAVINALGGIVTRFLVGIEQGPAVVEYADAQRDASGEIRGVMKRAYVFVSGDRLLEVTGYKVGDLVKIYLGQVQTDPTLVGYVEGAPPLPSENLTQPDFENPAAYFDIGSVTLTEADAFTTTLASSREDNSHLAFELAGGAAADTEAESGQFLFWQITKVEGKLGVTVGIDWKQGESHGQSVDTGQSTSKKNAFSNGGAWEEPDANGEVYLRSGERRFLPGNEGYALVKSRTADLYSFHLKSTGALVSLQLVPNTSIPEDVNIISFPLAPAYVKNGTLDGRVGLQPDPDPFYRSSDQLGSYFKPVQAYALKRQIELEEERLVAYYSQFDAKTRGKTQQADLDDALEKNPFVKTNPYYDWENDLPKRDLVNTYVWSAAGGIYTESSSFTSAVKESFGGTYTFSWDLGFEAEFKGIFSAFGPYFQLSLKGGTDWTVNVTKEKSASREFGLEVDAKPSRVLGKYLGPDGVGPARYKTYYSREPEPGKVDGYRFMTFYLAPRETNTKDFFDEVVDKAWLDLSADPRASALRQARTASTTTATWRVLHRVTYVSRVPPRFQAAPDASASPIVAEPVNQQANSLMLELVASRLPSPSPSTAEIGKAIDEVVTADLPALLPWWADFLRDAAVPNSPQALALREIQDDSLAYLSELYEARRVRASGFTFQYRGGKRRAG